MSLAFDFQPEYGERTRLYVSGWFHARPRLKPDRDDDSQPHRVDVHVGARKYSLSPETAPFLATLPAQEGPDGALSMDVDDHGGDGDDGMQRQQWLYFLLQLVDAGEPSLDDSTYLGPWVLAYFFARAPQHPCLHHHNHHQQAVAAVVDPLVAACQRPIYPDDLTDGAAARAVRDLEAFFALARDRGLAPPVGPLWALDPADDGEGGLARVVDDLFKTHLGLATQHADGNNRTSEEEEELEERSSRQKKGRRCQEQRRAASFERHHCRPQDGLDAARTLFAAAADAVTAIPFNADVETVPALRSLLRDLTTLGVEMGKLAWMETTVGSTRLLNERKETRRWLLAHAAEALWKLVFLVVVGCKGCVSVDDPLRQQQQEQHRARHHQQQRHHQRAAAAAHSPPPFPRRRAFALACRNLSLECVRRLLDLPVPHRDMPVFARLVLVEAWLHRFGADAMAASDAERRSRRGGGGGEGGVWQQQQRQQQQQQHIPDLVAELRDRIYLDKHRPVSTPPSPSPLVTPAAVRQQEQHTPPPPPPPPPPALLQIPPPPTATPACGTPPSPSQCQFVANNNYNNYNNASGRDRACAEQPDAACAGEVQMPASRASADGTMKQWPLQQRQEEGHTRWEQRDRPSQQQQHRQHLSPPPPQQRAAAALLEPGRWRELLAGDWTEGGGPPPPPLPSGRVVVRRLHAAVPPASSSSPAEAATTTGLLPEFELDLTDVCRMHRRDYAEYKAFLQQRAREQADSGSNISYDSNININYDSNINIDYDSNINIDYSNGSYYHDSNSPPSHMAPAAAEYYYYYCPPPPPPPPSPKVEPCTRHRSCRLARWREQTRAEREADLRREVQRRARTSRRERRDREHHRRQLRLMMHQQRCQQQQQQQQQQHQPPMTTPTPTPTPTTPSLRAHAAAWLHRLAPPPSSSSSSSGHHRPPAAAAVAASLPPAYVAAVAPWGRLCPPAVLARDRAWTEQYGGGGGGGCGAGRGTGCERAETREDADAAVADLRVASASVDFRLEGRLWPFGRDALDLLADVMRRAVFPAAAARDGRTAARPGARREAAVEAKAKATTD